MPADPIILENLAGRHPGLTTAIGDGYCEAAAVCMSRHHTPPSQMAVDCNAAASVRQIDWPQPGERVARAWANEIDATEAGAYGISLATIELEKGLVAIMRAETLTGADYYMAPAGSALDDLEKSCRLEVSGTDRGSAEVIKQRLREKSRQAAAGASNLPAIAAVVGFRERVVAIADVVRQ